MAVRYVVVYLLVSWFNWMSSGQSCDWEPGVEPNQGLDPRALEAGARRLLLLEKVTDMERCREECCAHQECQVAMLGFPQDGTPQCFLVSCENERGEDVCVFQPDHQFEVSRIRSRNSQSLDGEPLVASLRAQNSTNTTRTTEVTDTDRCRQPMRVGSCRAAFPKFYYDVTNQSCKSFIYGGCEPNSNNFDSLEECETVCSGVTGTVLPDDFSPQSRSKSEPRMSLLPSDNPVLAVDEEAGGYSKSSHDKSERSATGIIPNDDTGATSPTATLPEMSAPEYAENCEAEPKVGPCRASIRLWYYNSQMQTCKPFIFGGCRGNKNSYETKENCMAACTVTVISSSRGFQLETQAPAAKDQAAVDFQEYCTAAPEPGPCRAAHAMFYYQQSSGTCQPFLYGGCRGNKNRFHSMDECLDRCSGEHGSFEERGYGISNDRWTPAFFLVGTLAMISLLLLVALVLITVRRAKLPRRISSVSDKEELLPETDEQSSVESLSIPGSPKPGHA